MHKRFVALDGIRGFAALGVLVYHSILGGNRHLLKDVLDSPVQSIPQLYDKVAKIVLSIFYGPMDVMIFFILSGLVLSLALHKSTLNNPLLLNLEFILKRIVRIYPTLIVSIVLFWASRILLHKLNPHVFNVFGVKALFNNATLINTVINGATWTLQVEIMAIPFILICFFVQKKLGLKGLVLILFYTILCLESKDLRIPNIPPVLYQNLPPFVCGFILGSRQAEHFFTVLAKDVWFFVITLCGIFVVPLITAPVISSTLVQLVCASSFLGGIYYRQFTAPLKLLESRPSVYLGKISYSFYLNNVIFLYICYPILAHYPPAKVYPLEFGFLIFVICAILGIIVSHITEKYVEQPSIKFGKIIARFLSIIETKYLMRPVMNTGTSMMEDLQSATAVDQEIAKE